MNKSKNFLKLVFKYEPVDVPLELYMNVLQSYDKQSRTYHNSEHIVSLLHTGWERGLAFYLSPQERLELFFSVLLHDVYQGNRDKRSAEEQSATFSEFFLQRVGGISEESIQRVANAIRKTEHHLKDQEDLNTVEKYMLDLDLHTFSLPFETHLTWSSKVQGEYASVPEKLYLEGRIQFLTALNQRKKLYYTAHFDEKRARANILAEIHNLKQQLERPE